jgi:hypothetical protein
MTSGEIRHALKDRRDDLYQTDPVATHALVKLGILPHHIWEPACGRGAIVNILRAAGHTVWATDLVDYRCPHSEHGVDFLMERQTRIDVEAIVTNPPFKLANEFVRHALDLCPRVIMLLRLGFLESDTVRNDVMDGGALKAVYVFRNRIPMMHRDGWQGKISTSKTPYAWFEWDRAHRGDAIVKRISWEAIPAAHSPQNPVAQCPESSLPFTSV